MASSLLITSVAAGSKERWSGDMCMYDSAWLGKPLSHGLPVLSLQGCINLTKKVEVPWDVLLDGKDEGQCHQLLPSQALLQ